MSVVIQVDRLSKEYRLGQIGGKRLVDDVNRWWAKLRGKEDPLSKIGAHTPEARGKNGSSLASRLSPLPSETLYALRDVSFEVRQGEVLGIIGRNGAGKSTLLKILSRVTAPTSGEIRVKGRIASLLEVGTGFHPELTGRENIFLNGAILGMTKAEIRSKFDEIVAFAEVEKFIDTPVKRYSSGMYVRLAFAVAAHLEPEILIVDEVLAVGDAQFQKKCLGKMKDVAGQGRTVLFVSHNMPSVINLCQSALLVEHGQISSDGAAESVVEAYLSRGVSSRSGVSLRSHPRRSSGMSEILRSVRLLDGQKNPTASIKMGESFTVEVRYDAEQTPICPKCGIGVQNAAGLRVVSLSTVYDPKFAPRCALKSGLLRCECPNLELSPGRYSLTITIATAHVDLDRVEEALVFDVTPWDVFDTGVIPNSNQGVVWTKDQRWSLSPD